MTTAAWDGHTLSVDTQRTGGYIDQCEVRKCWRVRGALIAGAGNYENVLEIVDWYRAGADVGKRPAVNGHTEILVIRDGVAYECSDACRLYRAGCPVAIGCGASYAMAAMLAGADSRRAVQIAAKLDEGTGGKVRTYKNRSEVGPCEAN